MRKLFSPLFPSCLETCCPSEWRFDEGNSSISRQKEKKGNQGKCRQRKIQEGRKQPENLTLQTRRFRKEYTSKFTVLALSALAIKVV